MATGKSQETEAPSLAGMLFTPQVEVTVATRQVEVTEEHRAIADRAIAEWKKDKSTWLTSGPLPKSVSLADGTTKELTQKEVDEIFDEFLLAVKVAGAEKGFAIRKGRTDNPRTLRYHVQGEIKATNGS